MQHIDSYSFGTMTVSGTVYRADVIIFPDSIKAHWWRAEDHQLCPDDLEDVFKFQPELLIVGTGAAGCMEILADTRRVLEEKHIALSAGTTYQAVHLFNEELGKNRKVAGAFHLTC